MLPNHRRSIESLIFAGKRFHLVLGAIIFLVATCLPTMAQMKIVPGVTTAAGDGTAGFAGDNGPATSAEVNRTEGIATDSVGNLYIADWQNNRIRKVTAATGIITTVAGNGTAGFAGDGGPATSAELKGPTGIFVDSAGNLYIADQANNRVRKVDVGTGVITTVAGNGTAGFSGDGSAATSAEMYSPTDLALDSAGNLFIADNANNRIRKVAAGTGVITTYAGNGAAGFAGDGAAATAAQINSPAGLALDGAGNLYIADVGNNRIRKVTTGTGVISTYAGTGTAGFAGDGGAAISAQLSTPARVTFDKAGNLYIADQGNNRVREVSQGPAIITTVAGTGTAGFTGDGGPATSAEFSAPLGIAVDNAGNFYVSDFNNNRIRTLGLTTNKFPATTIGTSSVVQNILLQTTAAETITSITVPQSQGGKQEYSIGTITGCTIGASNPSGTVCTIPVTFTPAYSGPRWVPLQVVTSTGNINFGLTGVGVGAVAALTPGIITTVAGNGTAGFAGDGGAATSAQLNTPVGVAFDSAGNLYIGDNSNNGVRKVNVATGVITTVAGTGTAGFTGDGGPATSAELNAPEVVALDSAGNLYIAEYSNNRIRKVAAATGIITTVAGNGTQNYSGDGGPATSAALWTPTGVALDSAGNLIIADFGNHRIRKVDAATGIITTVAGNGTQGYSGDGGPATSAELGDPTHVVLDSVGNLIIADPGNNRVRKVTLATGIITTVAGNGTGAYSGDGGPATSAALHNPEYLAFDSADNLYVGDYLNNRVRKVNAVTGIITTVAGNGAGAYAGDGGAATSAALQYPSGIAFDNAGNLYVSDLGNSRIRKLDLSQSVLTYPTATKVGTSDSTDNPQTVTVENVGNADLTVPPPSAGSNPSVSLNFALDNATTCPQLSTSSSSQTLTTGAQCTYAIDFAPTMAGAITGSAVVTDNSLNIVGSTQTIHLNATGVAVSTTTTLASSLNPSAFSQAVTFTATVAPTAGTALPTGTVQFSVDGTAVGGPVTLNASGAAPLTSSTLTAGTHSITAVYTPDSTNFTGSSATALSQIVSKATLGQNGVANIALNSSPNPSNVGQSVTFTATVPSGVTGTVTFKDGATTLGTGTISGTTATFATTTLAVGTHPVTAVYSGDTNYNTATSAITSQVVNSGGATNTTFLPPIPVATTSAPQNITFTLPATGTITSITIPQSQGGKQEYAIQSITGCTVGASNPAGTVCTVSITFTPAYPGQRSVPLQVVNSAGNFNVDLTGTGLGPLVALTPGIITTVAGNGTAGFSGDGGPATSAEINAVFRQGVDSAGNIYIAEYANNRIRKVDAATGIITTIAGNGTAGFSGDGGPATSAELNHPQGVSVDSAGNIYIADFANVRIRKVDAATGVITTVAGNGLSAYSGDGGAATSAGLVAPGEVKADSAGNLYITDYNGCRIRKVAAGTGIITTVAGNGTPGYSGDGGPATSAELQYPGGVAFDSAGNLYITDQRNNRIRKVSTTTGIITTVAGNGTQGFSGDGGPATSAELYYPGTIDVDSANNLYFSDQFNNRIRKVDAGTGVITTLAGTGPAGYSGDGGPATSADLGGALGISLDSAGNILIADYGNNRIRKVDVSQSELKYPTATTVGTSDSTDDPQTAVVSNIGNAALTIPPASSGSNPNVSLNFALNAATTCPQQSTSSSPQTLAAGANCTYAVNFMPTTAGALTGSGVLTDNSLNAVGSAQTISLSGTGVAVDTTTVLSSSVNPSRYTQSVTFTATVAPTAGTALPRGTVQFSVDGTPVGGPVTLNGSGAATLTSSTLTVGTHGITAVYTPGSTDFTGSSATALNQVVNKGTLGQNGLANITLTSSPNPSTFAQSVVFTATVPGGVTGTVQFVDGATVLGTGTISGITATYTTSTLAVGTHPVTAVYSGDANYNSATSSVDSQVVTTVSTSTTTLSVAPTTVMYGDPATLTAVVGPSFATGTVSFYEGVTLLGTASLDNTGSAVLPISTLNAGVHNITAKYNGDPIVPPSTSSTVQLTVTQRTAPGGGPAITVTVNDATRTTTQANPPFTYSPSGQLVNGDTYATAIGGTATYSTTAGSAPGTYSVALSGLTSANYTIAFVAGNLTVTISPSTTTLVASPSSPQYGDPVALTATVTSGATGTVSFYDGSVLLGTGTVSSGVATLTTTTLVAGTHTVTATYNGDATYASSQSGPATVTVAKKTALGGGAALTITVQNASRSYDTADPQFNYVVTGTLVNSDTYATAVTGAPTYSAADTSTSAAGSTFPISVSGLNSANYEIALVNGTLTIVSAATTTTLTTSTNLAQYGDPITLTATVAPSGATGTVVFMNGSTVLGTGTVSGGVATLTTTTLAAGSYTITSSYQGDTNYGASTSGPVTLTVSPRTAPGGGAALTVTVNNASRTYGQGNPAFSYTVTGTLVNGDTYATAVTGVPVYSTTAMSTSPAGTYPISITGGLNSTNYVIAFANGALTVTKATLGQNGLPNITLVSSPNPSAYQQAVTFTATVPSGVTGTVQFVDGTTVLGTGTISGTTATFTTSALAVGTHPITAVYSGDANYNPATSAVDNQVVGKATLGQNGLADITLVSSPNPSAFAQSVLFTATVPSGVTGTVQFVEGATVLGTGTISVTTAMFTISTLAVGTHPVTAVYSGEANYNSATSAVDNQAVTTVPTSTTTLSVAPSTVMYGDPATLTAVVLPGFATGTVSFYEGGTLLGTASLDNTGTAVLPISTLNAGVHNITARYNGDSNVPANTSNTAQLTVTQRTAPGGGPAITVTVNDAARTTTQSNPPFTYSPSGQLVNGDSYATAINGTPTYSTAAGNTPGTFSITIAGLSSANYTIAFAPGNLTVTISPSTTTLVVGSSSPQYGDPVTLTATVTSGATGSVSFYDGSVLLGTGTVSNGVATLTTTTLVAGAHTITTVYNGDATYASSQSGPATVTVAKKTGAGGGAALTITVQNASRPYGTSDPQFNYVVTGTLVNADTYAMAATGAPVYSAADTPTSAAGSTFPIGVNGLSSANYEIAIVPGTLTIVAAPTTTTLATSTNSAQYGDPITLTATIVPSGATGAVVFTNGSTVLGTGTVSGGVATLTTSALPAGAYTITSSYQGDANFGASTSGPVSITINPRTAPGGGAALTVTVNDATRLYGQGNPAFTYTVAGSLVNGDTYTTAVVGVPVYSTTGTPTSPVGSYSISVAGLNSNNYVVAFVSGTLTVTKATPGQGGLVNVTVSSTPDPAVPGQPVTFTATVPPGVTGTITFMDGNTVLGTATIVGTTATLTTTTLPTGTHPVTAVYGGDANHNSATSAVDTVVVGQVTPALDFTLILTSVQSQTVISGMAAPYAVRVAPTSSTYPGVVTFTATGLPSGATVTFTPTTVAVNGGPTAVNLSIKTASVIATNRVGGSVGSIAWGLLLLPLFGARRMRRNGRVAGRYFSLIFVLLAGIIATAGLTGCGSHNGFFGHAPQTYTITITATSGTIQHSVNATLNVQ